MASEDEWATTSQYIKNRNGYAAHKVLDINMYMYMYICRPIKWGALNAKYMKQDDEAVNISKLMHK